jgi:hypothetical protein
MSTQLCYWVLFLILLAVELTTKPLSLKEHRTNVVLFAILFLLGWRTFGPLLHQ